MARFLIIAYTTYEHDPRVRLHAEALAGRGDSVDVIALASGREGIQRGVNVIGVPIPRYRGASRASYLRSYLRFFSIAAAWTYRLSRPRPYDLVIACTMPDTAILSALPARLFGSRLILDVHDTMPELYEEKFGGRRGAIGARLLMTMERVCAHFADRVFAVHELHRLRLVQAGIPAAKISSVMNLPPPWFFANRPAAPDGGGFVLTCHGTITRRLGIDVAIKAVSLLAARIADLRLRVIGGGDYLPQARLLAESLSLGGKVSFEGLVPAEELPRRLAGTAIGLVPNYSGKATHLMLPVKLLEYATMGIPVISSRLRTVEHYFPDGAVHLVTPGDPHALADAIEKLYHDPVRRRVLGQRARRIARELSWNNQRQSFFDAIDGLLGRHGPGAAGDCSPGAGHSQLIGKAAHERSLKGL